MRSCFLTSLKMVPRRSFPLAHSFIWLRIIQCAKAKAVSLNSYHPSVCRTLLTSLNRPKLTKGSSPPQWQLSASYSGNSKPVLFFTDMELVFSWQQWPVTVLRTLKMEIVVCLLEHKFCFFSEGPHWNEEKLSQGKTFLKIKKREKTFILQTKIPIMVL